MVGIIACSFSLNAQNKETQCEQFYKDAKKAYDKGDYEVALIFFNRCKAEDCKNADFQIYIDVCNMKLGKNNNAVTINNGVEINGVIWATCNVGECGKFVDNPKLKDELYTWVEAQNVCPTGWRLPTLDEIKLLEMQYSTWTSEGREFGNDNNKIFLPAAGCFNYALNSFEKVGMRGYYWCYDRTDMADMTEDGLYLKFLLGFDSDKVVIYGNSYKHKHSVRCISE